GATPPPRPPLQPSSPDSPARPETIAVTWNSDTGARPPNRHERLASRTGIACFARAVLAVGWRPGVVVLASSRSRHAAHPQAAGLGAGGRRRVARTDHDGVGHGSAPRQTGAGHRAVDAGERQRTTRDLSEASLSAAVAARAVGDAVPGPGVVAGPAGV